MKACRIFYVTSMYILAAPLLMLMIIGVAMIDVYDVVRYRDIDFLGDGVKAVVDGFKEGHRINMYWVEHGTNYYEDLWKYEKES